MTPRLLRKIEELVRAGATVVGSPPAKSPSLTGYPKCDAEVAKLACELWGEPQGKAVAERKVGKGRVIFGTDFVTRENGSSNEPNPVRHARWIWYPEGNPALSAPAGKRYFRRTVEIGSARKVVSARMAITADNAFELWINGKRAGSGDNFKDLYKFDAASLLKPGANVIAVAAENQSDKPNPAGLLASLTIRFADGTGLDVESDRKWQSAINPSDGWISGREATPDWKAAMDLGPFSMAPWNVSGEPPRPAYEFPPYKAVTNVLAKMNVPPDFESGDKFRYIHRRAGDTEIYFVSNPASNWVNASCAFRVAGKSPELWCPISGTVKKQLVYEKRDGRTIVPLSLEPSGSMFVVFRKLEPSESARIVSLRRNDVRIPGETIAPESEPVIETCAAPGDARVLAWRGGHYTWMNERAQIGRVDVPDLPAPTEIGGPWEVRFQPHRGAPENLSLDKLTDWAQHPNAGVKYFSGLATYTTTFKVSADSLRSDSRLFLDLGKVAVIAQLRVNGKDFGTLWRAPFRADITSTVRAGANQLEVKVVNLWINRMIGDEQLPEDSARNPGGTLKEWPQWVTEAKTSPTGRYTFSSWRLWKKDSPLQESGLIGPVRLVTAKEVELRN
jgi:hypothetical protein